MILQIAAPQLPPDLSTPRRKRGSASDSYRDAGKKIFFNAGFTTGIDFSKSLKPRKTKLRKACPHFRVAHK